MTPSLVIVALIVVLWIRREWSREVDRRDKARADLDVARQKVKAAKKALAEAETRQTRLRDARERLDELKRALAEHEKNLGLKLAATTERQGSTLTLRLSRASAEVVITLEEPRVQLGRDGPLDGEFTLRARDRASGAALVEAIAQSRGEPVPAEERGASGEPVTFRGGYTRVASGEDADVFQLTVFSYRRSARILLGLHKNGTAWITKYVKEDHPGDLLALLARVLRDGPPRRRTPESDPNLASSTPLASELTPVAGVDGEIRPVAWVGADLLGVSRRGTESALLLWSDLAKPPRELARVEGLLVKMGVAPSNEKVALHLSHPTRAGIFSTADPVGLVLLDIASGETSPIVPRTPDCHFVHELSWSPTSAKLAVGGLRGREGVARVYDVTTRELVAETDPARHLTPIRWTPEGLVLEERHGDPSETCTYDFSLWNPPDGALVPTGRPAIRSPGGAFTVVLGEGALEILSSAGRARFEPVDEDDRQAITWVTPRWVEWVGGHGLLLKADEPVVLDLETRKLRYLFPRGPYLFEGASPDGTCILAHDRCSRLLLWSRAAP